MAHKKVSPRILWLEPNPHYIDAYLITLEDEGFSDVHVCRSIPQAIAHLTQHGPPEILIYEDVLATYGTEFTLQETDNGFRSGEIFLARHIRPRYPQLRTWMITDHRSRSEAIRAMHHPKERSWANAKLDLLPDRFIEELRRILQAP